MWLRNNLLLVFIVWFAVTLAIGFVFGSDGKRINSEVKLSTLESSELYFRNVRANSYYLRGRSPEGVAIYELKSFEIDSNYNTLTPLIVDNWRQNLAYLQLEPNFDAENYWLIFENGQQVDSLFESFPKRVQQFELALRILNAIEAGEEIYLSKENETRIPLFSSEKRKKRFLIVLRDYFRLVNVM